MFYDTKPDHSDHACPHRRYHRAGPHHHGGRHHREELGGGLPRFGRKLRAEDSRLVLLALLESGPSHGYDLIRRLSERSGGFYAPSSGVIYPALAELEVLGHVNVADDGKRKSYAITPQGAAHLAAFRGAADAILETLARIGGRMEEVREAFAGVAETGDEAEALHAARHALKQAMRGCTAADPLAQARIAAILREAAASIAAILPPDTASPAARDMS